MKNTTDVSGQSVPSKLVEKFADQYFLLSFNIAEFIKGMVKQIPPASRS